MIKFLCKLFGHQWTYTEAVQTDGIWNGGYCFVRSHGN